MKKLAKFLLVLFFCGLTLVSQAQSQDSVAYKIIEQNLNIIENYLRDNKSDPTLGRVNAIAFLTDLTTIPSESTGNYVGQYSPTEKDFFLWKIWYKEHKSEVLWDADKRKIIIHRMISVPHYTN